MFNQLGGPIFKVDDPNDSAIEDSYEVYRVSGAFVTDQLQLI